MGALRPERKTADAGQRQRDVGRFQGALLGLAVGDAIGTTVEFKPPGTFAPVTDMVGGGSFRLPAGAWTDDTSMALCLAESLIERGGFDSLDQLDRYVRWYRDGYLSSIGRCFDIGNATRAALERFERTREPFPGDAFPTAGGNGPLMRLAPVPLAFALDPEQAIKLAADSARTTHGAPQAVDACRYFAGLLIGALNGASVSELLHAGVFEPVPGIWEREPLHPEVAAVAAGSFMVKEPPAIRDKGYVVEALEAALWALRSTRTFEDGVLAAANLGYDADTTAAIFGQLAGALYGVDAIPCAWRDRVFMSAEIVAYADGLLELAEGNVDGSGRPTPPPGDSYWVVPGTLLAGPYPGAPSKAEAQGKLDAFLDAGVTCFVDLTEEGEGPPLHPYAQLLKQRAARRSLRVTHLRLPIRDLSTPLSWEMGAILGAIRAAIQEGETVYVHCWGGVGRTGTVIGCLLVELDADPDDVLGILAELRQHTQRAARRSPETEEQRKFVRAWRLNGGTLVLDQQATDRLGLEPVLQDRAPVPSADEIVATLRSGNPVVIEGPESGWCVQAVADLAEDLVHIEVLDPEYWESGEPLPLDQQRVIEHLGFIREQKYWAITTTISAGESTFSQVADLMLAVVNQAWMSPNAAAASASA